MYIVEELSTIDDFLEFQHFEGIIECDLFGLLITIRLTASNEIFTGNHKYFLKSFCSLMCFCLQSLSNTNIEVMSF